MVDSVSIDDLSIDIHFGHIVASNSSRYVAKIVTFKSTDNTAQNWSWHIAYLLMDIMNTKTCCNELCCDHGYCCYCWRLCSMRADNEYIVMSDNRSKSRLTSSLQLHHVLHSIQFLFSVHHIYLSKCLVVVS